MKILLVGSGGREHALAWSLAKSPKCDALYCAPGNAGIEDVAELVDVDVMDVEALVAFTKERGIDFVIVGPEAPLVAGLADKISEIGVPVFGPSAAAAQLEGSKGFMKDLCKKYDIPTAGYERFTDIDAAIAYIEAGDGRIVVKADGLAAGKGVIIPESKDEAIEAARDMLSGNAFGGAGAEVVIEDFMDGEEVSYFALADGKSILPLVSAQDHKRAFDGDKGPNTGGMGAYSPARLMDEALEQKILSRIIEPTVKAMEAEGCAFSGVLFAGLMIVDGEPKLIEYNARFGDPECQVIMLRLDSDLVDILYAAASGKLDQASVQWSDHPAMCVVMASDGYPAGYEKNTVIKGLDAAGDIDDLVVFHAGTARNEAGDLVNIGGRVLGVSAMGKDLNAAANKCYRGVDLIDWPKGFCRRDIGWRALKAEAA